MIKIVQFFVNFKDNKFFKYFLIIDRLGNESHAKLIEERYLEVKDDYEFLNFISKNARQYYTDYLSRENRVNHTIKLLNL